jgi:hypothetical protein
MVIRDPLPEGFLQILVVNVPNKVPSMTAWLIRLLSVYTHTHTHTHLSHNGMASVKLIRLGVIYKSQWDHVFITSLCEHLLSYLNHSKPCLVCLTAPRYYLRWVTLAKPRDWSDMWHVIHFGVVKRTAGRDIDSLQTGRSGDRIPMEARYSVPVQIGPEVHPASCTIGTWFHSWGYICWGHGVNHPPQSSAEVKEVVELQATTTLLLSLQCRLFGELYLLPVVLHALWRRSVWKYGKIRTIWISCFRYRVSTATNPTENSTVCTTFYNMTPLTMHYRKQTAMWNTPFALISWSTHEGIQKSGHTAPRIHNLGTE